LTIEENLERIATALETLAGIGTTLADKPAKPAKGKAAAAKPAKEEATPAAKETPAPDADPEVSNKDHLRATLHEFQVEHGAKVTKEIMSPFGATIGKIKEGDYDKLLILLGTYEAK